MSRLCSSWTHITIRLYKQISLKYKGENELVCVFKQWIWSLCAWLAHNADVWAADAIWRKRSGLVEGGDWREGGGCFTIFSPLKKKRLVWQEYKGNDESVINQKHCNSNERRQETTPAHYHPVPTTIAVSHHRLKPCRHCLKKYVKKNTI